MPQWWHLSSAAFFFLAGIQCSYSQLHRMLQTAEEDIKKGVPTLISKSSVPSSSSSQSAKTGKKKKKKAQKTGSGMPPKGKTVKPTKKKKQLRTNATTVARLGTGGETAQTT